jgi:hypothetical protein
MVANFRICELKLRGHDFRHMLRSPTGRADMPCEDIRTSPASKRHVARRATQIIRLSGWTMATHSAAAMMAAASAANLVKTPIASCEPFGSRSSGNAMENFLLGNR